MSLDLRPRIAARAIERMKATLVCSPVLGTLSKEGVWDEWEQIIVESIDNDLVFGEGNTWMDTCTYNFRLVLRFLAKYPDLDTVLRRNINLLKQRLPGQDMFISLRTDPESEGVVYEKQSLHLDVGLPIDSWEARDQAWGPIQDLLFAPDMEHPLLSVYHVQSEPDNLTRLQQYRLRAVIRWTDDIDLRTAFQRGENPNEHLRRLGISSTWLNQTDLPESNVLDAITNGLLA